MSERLSVFIVLLLCLVTNPSQAAEPPRDEAAELRQELRAVKRALSGLSARLEKIEQRLSEMEEQKPFQSMRVPDQKIPEDIERGMMLDGIRLRWQMRNFDRRFSPESEPPTREGR